MKKLLLGYFVVLVLLSTVVHALAMNTAGIGLAFLGLLFCLFVALVFTQVLAGRIIKPIVKMKEIVVALDNSEVIELPEFPQQDEIGALGRKLVGMASRNSAVEAANRDALTGLANRRYLMQRLQDMLEDGGIASVMFVDLDKFKPINDTHGHEVGDEALKKMAELMGTCVRDNDVLARIGGDEFVLAFKNLDMVDVLETRAKRVIELISAPFWVGDIRLKMGGSVGIAIAPSDGKTAEELLGAADEAMYAVKKSGRNSFKFYS